jgi:glycosyltransferase involved in cell wall biosynthesis
VDPFDTESLAITLRQVVTDGQLRRKLVERGFRQIRRFSWQRCAQEVLQILTTLENHGFD